MIKNMLSFPGKLDKETLLVTYTPSILNVKSYIDFAEYVIFAFYWSCIWKGTIVYKYN